MIALVMPFSLARGDGTTQILGRDRSTKDRGRNERAQDGVTSEARLEIDLAATKLMGRTPGTPEYVAAEAGVSGKLIERTGEGSGI